MTSDEWVEQMGVTLLDKANLQLAAKEQEVAALKAELTAAYESLGRDDTRARDAESQVADLKRELEEARSFRMSFAHATQIDQEYFEELRQRAETADARVKELESALQVEQGIDARMDDEITELQSRLAALISAAEPLMNWPAQDFEGESYRTIPADLFNGFAAAVEKAKAVT